MHVHGSMKCGLGQHTRYPQVTPKTHPQEPVVTRTREEALAMIQVSCCACVFLSGYSFPCSLLLCGSLSQPTNQAHMWPKPLAWGRVQA